MNKDHPYTEHWRISDMASHVPVESVQLIEPQGDSSVTPSASRIKQLALQKCLNHINGKEEKPMKKISLRLILVAAMFCLLSVTAFAAAGGLDYMKSIFGDSADTVKNEIVTAQIQASADGRDLALHALVTDGYITTAVVSLTGTRPSEDDLFTVSSDTGIFAYGYSELEDFTTAGETFYTIEIVSEQRFDAANITISLNRDIAGIDLSFPIENQLGSAVVEFPENTIYGQTQLKELQVSPMGFLLICHEENPNGGLPTTKISLAFADGKIEEIEAEFHASEETVGGGGGAVMTSNKNKPLVTMFHGSRNPDGELVIYGQFSRIINPANIEKVLIDGVEYFVK